MSQTSESSTISEQKKTAPRMSSSVRWFAFTTETVSNQVKILEGLSQKELKKQLTELGDTIQVHTIIKGKGFRPKIQKHYEFLDGGAEISTSDRTETATDEAA